MAKQVAAAIVWTMAVHGRTGEKSRTIAHRQNGLPRLNVGHVQDFHRVMEDASKPAVHRPPGRIEEQIEKL